ncbi:hypothetical protein WSQ_04820 [Anaplasma phagocytophilum str. JM]|nr:hypothetical protein WSQ_04820 [Anaplasma phagocytophilum str. JM]
MAPCKHNKVAIVVDYGVFFGVSYFALFVNIVLQ